MTILKFTLCMYCILSSGDLVRYVMANQLFHLPTNSVVRGLFLTITAPAMLGVFALPIYGFLVMSWWEPIVGIVAASILANLITRNLLAGSHWLYMWAIGFSVTGLSFFGDSVFG